MVLDTEPLNISSKLLVTDLATPLDEAFVPVVAQVHEDNGTKKEGVALKQKTVLYHQAAAAFCKHAAGNVGRVNAEYTIGENDLIDRRVSIDGATQVGVPQALQSHLLYYSHYLVTAGHPGKRKMYGSMRREFYWLHIGNGGHTTVSNCSACAKIRVEFKLKTGSYTYFLQAACLNLLPSKVLDHCPVLQMVTST